jgi:protein gp37
MNKSKIDWTDYTWNPVTGCYHTCPYCFARRQSLRFSGDIRLNLADERCEKYQGKEGLYILHEPFITRNERSISYPFGFAPTFHEYRLDWPGKVKNGANVFVCSMADLFGDWIPNEWIQRVFDACERYPRHNYMFLTKNPERYLNLYYQGRLPEQPNFWYGTTITNQDDYEDRAQKLIALPQTYKMFFSIEPIHSEINMGFVPPWIIIGAETGNRKGKVIPKRKWIENIVFSCTDEAVFMKKSIRELMGDEFIQEFPAGLLRKEISPKLKAKLWDSCKFCDVEKKKKEMIALLYRKKRGEGAKQLGYACQECFEKLSKEFESEVTKPCSY